MASVEPKILIPFSEYQRLHQLVAKYEKLIEEHNNKGKLLNLKTIYYEEHQEISVLCSYLSIFISGSQSTGSTSGSQTTNQSGGALNEEERKCRSDSHSPESSSSIEQIGGSFNADQFVNKIASIVTERVTKNLQYRAAQPMWKNYEISEPTITSQVVSDRGAQPQPFNSDLKQNDLSDQFDGNHLLKLIPKRYKSQAQILLKACDERAAEFTFNSDGVVFIDGGSLPGTNIFVLFPALFKHAKNRVKLVGFMEVIQKLKDMGLAHLILNSNEMPKVKKEKKSQSLTSSKTNWWYLN